MWPWTAHTEGHLYLFHFHRPLGNVANARAMATHYVGFAEDLHSRLAVQFAGKGAKIVAAAIRQGITFDVYHWPAPLIVEKLVKRTHKTALYCPTCAAAAGRLPRPLPVPAAQLALPLNAEPLPEIIPGKMDYLEIRILQGWRQSRAVGASAADDWDDGLL